MDMRKEQKMKTAKIALIMAIIVIVPVVVFYISGLRLSIFKIDSEPIMVNGSSGMSTVVDSGSGTAQDPWVIENRRITTGAYQGDSYAGIILIDVNNVIIRNCELINTETTPSGGYTTTQISTSHGIDLSYCANVTIINNIISWKPAFGSLRRGISVFGPRTGMIIQYNQIESTSQCIAIVAATGWAIRNNIFTSSLLIPLQVPGDAASIITENVFESSAISTRCFNLDVVEGNYYTDYQTRYASAINNGTTWLTPYMTSPLSQGFTDYNPLVNRPVAGVQVITPPAEPVVDDPTTSEPAPTGGRFDWILWMLLAAGALIVTLLWFMRER